MILQFYITYVYKYVFDFFFSDLKRHEYKVHGIKKLPNVCEVCYTPYKNVHKCQATRKRNYDNERNSACNICGKKYSRKVKLRQHIMNFHNTDTSEKIHICKHCGKSYGTPALLKAHIDQFHNRENCPHCGKSVLNRFYLKKHLVFDHGVKDGALFCDVCPKRVFFVEELF